MEIRSKIIDKVVYYDITYRNAVSTFLRTNTRVDRDKVLRSKYKLETYEEVLKMIPITKEEADSVGANFEQVNNE